MATARKSRQLQKAIAKESSKNPELSGMIRANRFARIDSHDSRESGDSRESEIRVILANRPDAL